MVIAFEILMVGYVAYSSMQSLDGIGHLSGDLSNIAGSFNDLNYRSDLDYSNGLTYKSGYDLFNATLGNVTSAFGIADIV